MTARAAWISFWLVVVACGKSTTSIAHLEDAVATVERSLAGDEDWQPAAVGDVFVIGSAVRTGPASRAKLRLSRGGLLQLDSNAVVRFARREGKPRGDMQVEAGEVEIEAGDDKISLGAAMLEPGGRARLTSNDAGTTIRVVVGGVILEDGTIVAAGNSVTVRIGGAIIEDLAAQPLRDAAPPLEADVVAPVAVDAPASTGISVIVAGKRARAFVGGAWKVLTAGEHQLEPQTRLDAVAATTITVGSDGGRTVISGPADLELGGAAVALTAQSGKLSLNAISVEVRVAVPGGTVTARAGNETTAQLRGKQGTVIEARDGEAVIKSAIAEGTLTSGEIAVLEIDGRITYQSRNPTEVAFSIEAGESATIHDPRVPTAVAVRFANACPGTGTVEVAKDRKFARLVARSGGSGKANVQLPAGTHYYRVECPAGKGARGTVQVVRDSGSRPLPKTAARTLVEVDGREYVITYQNLLPELTLTWRNAPPRPRYEFVIQPATGDAKRIPSTTARVSLKSGDLVEGSYKFWVEIPGTGGRSDETRIVIDFDNAAPSASIEKVEWLGGGKVRVRGGVLSGTAVTAAGAKIEVDRHQRFASGELVPRAGEIGVAIRMAHPKVGVHYYVLTSSTK